jgi:hypothetical protein
MHIVMLLVAVLARLGHTARSAHSLPTERLGLRPPAADAGDAAPLQRLRLIQAQGHRLWGCAAPSRPPPARERLRGGFDVWGDDGDADDAERGGVVVDKRGEMRAHLRFSVKCLVQCWPASGD